MYDILTKTIIIYFIILILVRIMGKREIGQLSPFDFVVAIMIAEMAVIPIENEKITLIKGMFPIILLVLLEILIAFISLKSNFLRGLITGRPQILVKNGHINYENLKKTRYNINDLLMQLRNKDIFNVKEVDLAILEPSGELSVLKVGTDPYGFPVVIDGKISNNEKITGVSRKWVENKLKEKGAVDKEIVLATVNQNKDIEIYYKSPEKSET
ncbi:MAG: DUF421 domain-containing protein [Bacillota bacterium]